MSGKVEVGAVCETPKFLAAERIIEFEINRALAVVRPILRRHFELMHHALRQSDRLGKQMQSGCFVETDPILEFKGSDKTVDELWEGGKHALVASVRIKNSRVIRTRPLIPRGWKSDLTVKYDPAVIEPEQIVTALETAGREIGIGDWRPKYGRFSVG